MIIKGSETQAEWDGINWFTQIKRWGNKGQGKQIFGEGVLTGGPSGWLDKIHERKSQLEELDYVCEGNDKTRCLWPAGIYSSNKPYCKSGYRYSYTSKQCHQIAFGKPACSKLHMCKTQDAADQTCGGTYSDVCKGSILGCSGSCVPGVLPEKKELDF